jgi:hypothetical protein
MIKNIVGKQGKQLKQPKNISRHLCYTSWNRNEKIQKQITIRSNNTGKFSVPTFRKWWDQISLQKWRLVRTTSFRAASFKDNANWYTWYFFLLIMSWSTCRLYTIEITQLKWTTDNTCVWQENLWRTTFVYTALLGICSYSLIMQI